MEIYRALSDYTPASGALNVLSFSKGEQFEVLEDDRTLKEWWGARRLHDNAIGYIPAKYMKYQERRVGKLFTDIERRERDIHLQKLEEMQNQSENNLPAVYKQPQSHFTSYDDWKNANLDPPDVPIPDYSDDEDTTATTHPQTNNVKRLTEVYKNVPVIVAFDDWERKTGEPLDLDIPEPDYDDSEDVHNGSPSWNGNGKVPGLIEPKKLSNPCQDSPQRQDLHRELLMNTKMGINILKQKPELQRELERRRESQKRRDWELYNEQKKTGFEKKLEEQAQKIKMREEQERIAEKEANERPEFLKVHDKIRRAKSQS